ncbi:MAG: hypothetical protein B7X90_06530 [Novosphingobium sp. 17-62-19]|uniref:DUF4145 domain-containing protein n=1 Tax=Novosphingobium sp. 17-62-19 TaxID=1970406 RepID=UPI000BDA7C08|nr:DUF4145 domain-containing protein [Novosphingobium sp. 17-62-19]OYX89762.1 MAG: hypothetical protein B7Y74_16760 [Novosphingobium sp. 35-62-5]OZA20217.1 MAG: hypothetical protein B7X90_06530 [Novosphingobium sp. 17-62-19]OZA62607.1 MAG: hypothetical protein B7X78_06195 [Sphingomonadales bacterium 39-62-4]
MISLTIGPAEDWFSWSVSLIGALAWPLAALVIALVFRRPLLTLLARLDELSWGDKAARFAHKLDRLESEAPPALAEPDGPEIALTGDHGRFIKLLDLSPNAAVLDSWSRVEEALQGLALAHSLASTDAAKASRALQQRGVLPARTVGMIGEMRSLRNAAAHNQDISVSDALRFRNLAKGVLNEIRLA